MPAPRAIPHRLSLDLEPAEVSARLRSTDGLAWLDTALIGSHQTLPQQAKEGAWSYIATDPTEILAGHMDRDWAIIRDAVAAGSCLASEGQTPFTSGLIGWVGFDGNFCFGVYPNVLAFDHGNRSWWGRDEPQLGKEPRIAEAPALGFEALTERKDFVQTVERAREYIAAGDVYQVNLAYPWHAKWPVGADALGFYKRLRGVSPAPYAAYLDLAGRRLLSSSPECYLHMQGRSISTRPIKGTRPRFPLDAARDEQSRHELIHSAKEQAELLMITDLERNDLGQVCEYGSIEVPHLARVEAFAQVFHLISTVTGTLRAEVDHTAAFRACFPGGSISGAPKKRALEIIAELEAHPRGLYTGAIGYFGFNGQSQFSIAIRTAVQRGQGIQFHVGAGIVADSVPELEYEETLHKAAGLLSAAERC